MSILVVHKCVIPCYMVLESEEWHTQQLTAHMFNSPNEWLKLQSALSSFRARMPRNYAWILGKADKMCWPQQHITSEGRKKFADTLQIPQILVEYDSWKYPIQKEKQNCYILAQPCIERLITVMCSYTHCLLTTILLRICLGKGIITQSDSC